MSSEPFLSPHLTGSRFEDHAIPLEFLKDLAVLEEMIVEVAKSEFLRDNPSRQRCPRHFTEGIALKLSGLEDGSAVAVISLVATAARLFPAENQLYFERAREAVVSAISAAETNQPITNYLPEKTLSYFDRMGRSLRDGEAIEFTIPGRGVRARLTKETRRKLILASSKVQELTDGISVRGGVPEADQHDMTFEIQLTDGRRIKAPIAAPHLDTILEAFNGYKSGTRVLLQGIGRFSRNERLLRVDSIEHMSILDPQDIPARLDELRLLKDGWLEGQGQAPSREGLDWLSRVFGQHFPDDLPLPFLYPTVGGGIQAEWSLESQEGTLEIDLGEHTGQWHVLNMETDSEDSRTLDLNDATDWVWLVLQIRQTIGGAA